MKYIQGTKAEDLSGLTFNKLTVESFAYFKQLPDGKRRAYFNCVCNCEEHTKVIVSGASLKSGQVKSCGCLKKENGKKRREHNLYRKDHDCNIAEFYFKKGGSFIVDLDDFDLASSHYWYLDDRGYVTGKEYITGKTIRLHSILCPNFVEVDHINQNKLDNRKCNFREVTRQENVINRPISKRNSSGFIGVYWSKKDKSWYSQITINRKVIHLGYTSTKEKAIIQRLEAELQYFGKEFAPQRHLFEQYGIILTNKEDNNELQQLA